MLGKIAIYLSLFGYIGSAIPYVNYVAFVSLVASMVLSVVSLFTEEERTYAITALGIGIVYIVVMLLMGAGAP